MIWPFSLPPRIDASRQLQMPIDWAYNSYKYVFPIRWNHGFLFRDSTLRKELEQSCMHNFAYYIFDRVFYDRWTKRWISNCMGHSDEIFIVTNYDAGVTLLQLRWG
jgi:hypothetical protein